MTALPTLNGASPLDASDDSRLSFTADANPETLSRALDNTPADFGTMDDLSWQVEYRQQNRSDDTLQLGIRIMNGATVLAANDSGGTFSLVDANITNATDTTSSVTAFSYVNTTANKTTWDGASIELEQAISKSKGADGLFVEVDYVAITGNYSAGSTTTPQSVSGSTTPSGAVSMVVNVSESGAMTPSGDVLKSVSKGLDGSITLSGIVQTVKSVFQTIIGSLSPSGALATAFSANQAASGSITLSGDTAKVVGKLTDGQSSPSGALVKSIGKLVGGNITLSGANIKRVEAVMSGELTPAGTLATAFLALLSISGQSILSGIVNTLFIPVGTGLARIGIVRNVLKSVRRNIKKGAKNGKT